MGLDYDKLKNKLQRRAGQGWTPKEGDNPVRLFPHTAKYYTEQLDDFAIEFRSHFMNVPGMDVEIYRCARDKKEQCGLCAVHALINESKDPQLSKIASNIRSGERHLMNIMSLNDPGTGIQAYESGPKVYDEFLQYVSNPGWGEVLHPVTGRGFILNLVPQGKSKSGYNDYKVQPHPAPSDISAHLPADWQQKLDVLASSVPLYVDKEAEQKWERIIQGLLARIQPVSSVPPVPVPPVPPPVPPVSLMPPPAALPSAMPVASGVPPLTPPSLFVSGDSSLNPLPSTVFSTVSAGPGGVVREFVTKFAPQYGIAVQVKPKAPKLFPDVPSCFSEGIGGDGLLRNPKVGYNPNVWPCDKGCPVKADCQLTQLGLA